MMRMRMVRNLPQDRHLRRMTLWHPSLRGQHSWRPFPSVGEDRDYQVDRDTYFFPMLLWRRLWRKQHGRYHGQSKRLGTGRAASLHHGATMFMKPSACMTRSGLGFYLIRVD